MGNSMYTYYNACGKLIDRILRKHGAKRFYRLGLGDELSGMEYTFLDWQTGLVNQLMDYFSLNVAERPNQLPSSRLYRSVPVERHFWKKTKYFSGEPRFIGSYSNQVPPFTADNPFLAPVQVNRELHKSGTRSCRHIELDLRGSGLRYETGDHVAVLPWNSEALVNRIGMLLNIDLDHPISLLAVDSLNPCQQPFPSPCTYRTAFTHYVDITGPPRMNTLRVASHYAKDTKESDRLYLLGSSSPTGKEIYSQWILEQRRSIIDILEEFTSLAIPADVLLERLPRLKPRLYSISSSAQVYPDTVHLACAVVREYTPAGNPVLGFSLFNDRSMTVTTSPHQIAITH
ncbi:unnamed protein product [Echinostoma caproni]|uniref:FAD-binding FR-type domain-containing protein n=1 Tax=Echinostoma caproni TaxID=27848 RepID=A0A3P8HQJ5_9TREM|nr:unnamed protein product [Echinostoma caproni]